MHLFIPVPAYVWVCTCHAFDASSHIQPLARNSRIPRRQRARFAYALQASKSSTLIGAVAGLGILGYYNGFVRLLDIIPDATEEDDLGIEGYPTDRLKTLLNTMRTQYPNSQLWLLEEARMKSGNRDVEGAVEMLKNSKKSPLKQVEALQAFEKSMDSMCLHNYEDCAKFFLQVSTALSFDDWLV